MHQSSEHLQDKLLTKLLGQFIKLHNTDFLNTRKLNVRLFFSLFSHSIFKNWRLNLPQEAFIWKKKVGSRSRYSAQISINQDECNIYNAVHTYIYIYIYIYIIYIYIIYIITQYILYLLYIYIIYIYICMYVCIYKFTSKCHSQTSPSM